MSLEKYEDFLDLSIKDSTNFLSVCGLNTSVRKVELVARTFSAFELKVNIKICSMHIFCLLESLWKWQIYQVLLVECKVQLATFAVNAIKKANGHSDSKIEY